MNEPIFPAWTNTIRPFIAIALLGGPLYLVTFVSYGASPSTTDSGYAPIQPVPFSHAVHAGELGMDCRYCHTSVMEASFAAVPPTQTCMNCHARDVGDNSGPKPAIRAVDETGNLNAKLAPLYEAHENGTSVEWIKVHDLADYVYFNHSAHVQSGVSCVSCHGRVDTMEVVYQKESLSMGWCIECHRNPEPHLRPVDKVTDLDWDPMKLPEDDPYHGRDRVEIGAELRKLHQINPKTDCSVCHR